MSFGWALMYNMLIGIVVTVVAFYRYHMFVRRKFGPIFAEEFAEDAGNELETQSEAECGNPKMFSFLIFIVLIMLWEIAVPASLIGAYRMEKRAWMKQNGKLDD